MGPNVGHTLLDADLDVTSTGEVFATRDSAMLGEEEDEEEDEDKERLHAGGYYH